MSLSRKEREKKEMSLPYAPPCIDGKGIRQSHISEGVIVSPDGRPISHMCRSCAQRVIDEYKEKLGVIWTFEEREYEQIDPNRPLYVYDSPSVAASTLGRLGGLAKSGAKAQSSRENGKKGGRPRKVRENEETIDSANLDLFK